MNIAFSNMHINKIGMKNKLSVNSEKNNSQEIMIVFDKKIIFFRDVIQKTIIHVQKNKMLDILGVNDVNSCIATASGINERIRNIRDSLKTCSQSSKEDLINSVQDLNNELSSLIKSYGTESFEDYITVCLGNIDSLFINKEQSSKYELLKKFFHPTQYKILSTKNSEEICLDSSKNFECSDISHIFKQFHTRVYGIRVYIHHMPTNKHVAVYGIIDDVMVQFLQNSYIDNKLFFIKSEISEKEEFRESGFNRFLDSLTLKDYLINNAIEICNKYISYQTQYKLLKQKNLSCIVRDFIQNDLYTRRNTLIFLLIISTDYDNKYMAYLLYDLLSNDANTSVDTMEQTILFDSFPWYIKQYFKEAIKKTVQYTNSLTNFDISKIPLEQQICLMKTTDTVKEKAMIKLKEVKSKTEDSGSKARQYLDGLLKIPFGIYKKEPIMDVMQENKNFMKELLETQQVIDWIPNYNRKNVYTSIDILLFIKELESNISKISNRELLINKVKAFLSSKKKTTISSIIIKINDWLEHYKNMNVTYETIIYNTKSKKELLSRLFDFLQLCDIHQLYSVLTIVDFDINVTFYNKMNRIKDNFISITKYIKSVKTTLDDAVYGHEKAKIQIERIIGQWINGEQDGYCFGFEGPPGVGKTSLAKHGLSKCLTDENGVSRPFAMIQMGGDSNGSTLHGHNYTYVGSTWGNIVQILIDKKCMNPIIFIDELDKISKTEHGREIIGILTHLLDPTQNDSFQDKYFSGVDFDLSKALFILSYNDVDSIDKILLDRIHRIQFLNLSLEEKLIITKTHILPEIYKKMGLQDIIYIDDECITYIIDEYTSEPGVRKLKEIIFEIIGEVNIKILKYEFAETPIHIKINDIKNIYLKDRHELKKIEIHRENRIGVINGLWANSMGRGGILPIQVKFFPSNLFLQLKLTGMQGDVMKESMYVANTLAWSLTSNENRTIITELYEKTKHGIHVHCPEGAVPKDGPSAGAAITSVIYSLLNQKKIKHNIAITGEISLDGSVTEIGGLDVKFLGGIKSGVNEFIYPEENQRDFVKFMEKYKDTKLIDNILFHSVKTIQDVFSIIFENDK
uniref:Lon proteolytic domain-containing protein n=1 Tax=viral metagenome TaxID=1070528 RepID=A0A6C0B2A1_9ZZZZ